MTDKNKSHADAGPTRRLWWLGPLALLLIAAVALAVWLVPRRSDEIVSVDSKHRWQSEKAPPRHKIVFQPAERAEPLAARAGADDSLIRPALTDGGTALYFTLRSAGGGKDIYRSLLLDGKWQAAEPVEQLNTAADDIGPVIQADGQTLYLYSNREDSLGGLDLYVATRQGDGWSKPVNLGPTINSPADEFDPAVSSDGRRLFFESNRSPRMQQMIAEGKLDEVAARWRTTLRADAGLKQFDLYTAGRDLADEAWQTALPLVALNRPDSNEGAPFVSPSDAFLYFVSDRAWREGEEPNYDIYRARIRGDEVGKVENLGSGVNTPRNELEPALSPEGFRIFFSRNDDSGDAAVGEQYALYSSTAIEIEEQVAWDYSNWNAFVGFLSGIDNWLYANWWWIVFALLLLAFLAAIAWYLRQVSLQRASVPVFLLLALMMHLILGASTFLITFGGGIFAEFREKIKEVVTATEVAIEDENQSHEKGPAAYEKVAELKSLETVETEVARQTPDTPNVPIQSETLVPQVAVRAAPQPNIERPQQQTPQAQPPRVQDPTLQRRPLMREPPSQVRVELEATEAQQANEQTVQRPDVELQRQQPAPPLVNAPQTLKRRTIDPTAQLQREQIEIQRSEQQPVDSVPAEPQQLTRQQTPTPDTPTVPKVATETVKATDKAASLSARPAQIKVERTNVPTPQVEAPAMKRAAPSFAARPAVADTTIEKVAEPQAQPVEVNQPQLNKTAAQAPQPVPAAKVQTEQVAAAAATPASSVPESVDIDVARDAASDAGRAAPPSLRRRPATFENAVARANSELTIEKLNEAEPSATAITAEAPDVQRSTPSSAQPAASEVATEELGAPVGVAPAAFVPKGAAEVIVDRLEVGDIPTPAATAPALTVARSTAKPAALEGEAVERVEVITESSASAPALLNSPRDAIQLAGNTAAEPIQTDQITGPIESRSSENTPRAAAVEVQRQAGSGAELAIPDASLPTTKFARQSAVPGLAELDAPNSSAEAGGVPSSPEAVAVLDRATTGSGALDNIAAEAIETQQTAARPTAGTEGAGVVASGLGVQVERQDVGAASGPAATAQPRDIASIGVPRPGQTGALSRAALASAAPSPTQVAANVTRSQTQAGGVAQEVIETTAAGLGTSKSDANSEPQIAGLKVGVERTDAADVKLELDAGQFGGPNRKQEARLVLGNLAKDRVDAPLAGSPLGSRILERPARARPILFYAEDNIGLQALLRLRQTDKQAKADLIKAFGGDEETLEAIRRGLLWLSLQQHDDGSWKLNKLREVNGKKANGVGNINCDTAATGFALLPFLGDGNTHREGQYKANVAKGIKWLVDNQQSSGELTKGNEGNARMYGHGIATIALCECYALSRDVALRDPAQRAIDFIVSAQNPQDGGWRYQPRQGGDTSVVGWQVMALKSAQIAELYVPEPTFEGAKRWLQHVSGKGGNVGRFGYTSANDLKIAMTAEGLLCSEYLGAERDDPLLHRGAQHLLKNLPKEGKDSSYYWYYGTQVMYHMQGDYWKQWNDAFSPLLLRTQHKDGHLAGTWDPKDQWEKQAGRIYSTSLRVLMLEVYFRHLPLYQVLND